MIFQTFLAAIAMQAAGEVPLAIKNDTPDTWTLEYPRLIRPYVRDYYRCLNTANRIVRGEADFEEQHRMDPVRCAPIRNESIQKSVDLLTRRGRLDEFNQTDVAQTFDHLANIHIARGADLDNQFKSRIQAAQRAEETHDNTIRKELVIELADPSVVKSIAPYPETENAEN